MPFNAASFTGTSLTQARRPESDLQRLPPSRRQTHFAHALRLHRRRASRFSTGRPTDSQRRHIRIHDYRPEANYSGSTVYAFFETTKPNNFSGGPVPVTGIADFGAYFDVGVTADASNVGIILHKGDTKDPGPNHDVNPSKARRRPFSIEESAGSVSHGR